MARKLGLIGFVLVALGAAGLLYPTLAGDIWRLLWVTSIVSFVAGCVCLALSVLRRSRGEPD